MICSSVYLVRFIVVIKLGGAFIDGGGKIPWQVTPSIPALRGYDLRCRFGVSVIRTSGSIFQTSINRCAVPCGPGSAVMIFQ